MHYRTLGRTGLSVSAIGLGTAVYAGRTHGPFDEREAIAAIRAALDADVNYIDTCATMVLAKKSLARR